MLAALPRIRRPAAVAGIEAQMPENRLPQARGAQRRHRACRA
jgi:hypothetical protein